MGYRRTHRPVRRMTLEELRLELAYLDPLIRDVVAVKQARKSEIEAEISRRQENGSEEADRGEFPDVADNSPVLGR